MPQHIILGAGNLGLAIRDALEAKGESVSVISRSTGLDFQSVAISALQSVNDAHTIWCAVGAGSVGEAEKDFSAFSDLHIRLPILLAQRKRKEQKLVCFSSDYAAGESGRRPKSLYALSKKTMETALEIIDAPNTFCFRVCSLYGTHKPHSTFPGRVASNLAKGRKVSLPHNECVPTPVEWIAEEAIRRAQWSAGLFYENLIPSGKTTVHQWGRMLFGDRVTSSGGYDGTRPTFMEVWDRDRHPSWTSLWDKYGQKLMDAIGEGR